MDIACKIGTELAYNELNVRRHRSKNRLFHNVTEYRKLKRNVSSKNLPSLLRLIIQIPPTTITAKKQASTSKWSRNDLHSLRNGLSKVTHPRN